MSRTEFIAVVEAARNAAGAIDMLVQASIDGHKESIPYTYHADDPFGLAPKIGDWLEEHPSFVIGTAISPPPATLVPKSTVWRRMTDGEATQFKAALARQSDRIQQIFASLDMIDSADEDIYPKLSAALVQLFGADRAAELLGDAP